MTTIAYDLDGVLAAPPPATGKSWMRMTGPERARRRQELVSHYACALPLYQPTEARFWVVSARKNTPDVTSVTLNWLNHHFAGRVEGCRLLFMPRTIENVVTFKSHVLRSIRATEFTEDNRDILKGVQRNCPGIKLYYYNGAERQPY